MLDIKKCVYCGREYDEQFFHKGQIACKDCKKANRKDRLGKRVIQKIIEEKQCQCGSQRVLLLTTTNLLKMKIADIKELPAICIDCLLENNLK